MFIVLLAYKKPLEFVNRHLEAHRTFLDKNYQSGSFIMSGPKKPRTGGVILANGDDLQTVKNTIEEDPFYQHEIANYTFIEFSPNRMQLDNITKNA